MDVLAGKGADLGSPLALAVVGLCVATPVMPIDEEVPATRQRVPWPVAVLALALVIFVVAFCWLTHDED